MKEEPITTVIVSGGEQELGYRIVERVAGDERLVIEKLHPERTLEQVRAQDGSRAMRPEKFDTNFGQLPTDDEGSEPTVVEGIVCAYSAEDWVAEGAGRVFHSNEEEDAFFERCPGAEE